jgi:cation diffusion facilitator family transporter
MEPAESQPTNNPAHLDRLRRRAVVFCIVTTVVIAVVEIGVGWRFGLLSVFAEGLHTTADLIDSLVAFFLIMMASRPADRTHPFGHGKFDTLAGFLEGAWVGAAALWAIWMACKVLLGLTQPDPQPEMITIIAMAAASVVYWAVSAHVLRLSEVTRSPTVYAEAMHLRTHVYITIGLIVGLVLSRIGLARNWANADRIDSMVALALGVCLLFVAFRIVRPAIHQFMDRALPDEELREILDCLDEFRSEFVEVHAVRSRRSGTEQHVDIHMMVLPETTVQEGHDLTHRIEDHLVARHPGTRLLVHIEPADASAMQAFRDRDGVGAVMTGCFEAEKTDAPHR